MDAGKGIETLLHVAAACISDAVSELLPMTSADTAAINALTPDRGGATLPERLAQQRMPMTAGLWAFQISVVAAQWEESAAQDFAVVLPYLLERYPCREEAPHPAILPHAAAALAELAWLAHDASAAGEEQAQETAHAFHQLALAVERAGREPMAYNLAAIALDLTHLANQTSEELAHYALRLALRGGKRQQIALCSTALAQALVHAAAADPARRLEAFDACEAALERTMQTPPQHIGMAARALAAILADADYLRPLLLPLLEHLPGNHRQKWDTLLQGAAWPRRIAALPWPEWRRNLQSTFVAQTWDMELDKIRTALLPANPARHVYADWTDWKVDHPAYRRAVPHLSSFLKEKHFDTNYLVLSHELTHVLSLIGGYGLAQLCLRVAAFDAEITIWSMAGGKAEDVQDQICRQGVAEFEAGNLAALFRAEQGLELTRKAHVLQDTWTAWFEGLAMFGELHADIAQDPYAIGHVAGALRNLIDFFPDKEQAASPDSVHAAIAAHVADFERRCSAAMSTLGPGRLRQYLDAPDVPYFSGYVAIRAIVARWRKTAGGQLSGVQAYNLLLHATRYGTSAAIPDLSVHSGEFAVQAGAMMAAWARKLACLSRAEIEDFNAPIDPTGTGRRFYWSDGHLRPFELSAETEAKAKRLAGDRLRQAFMALGRADDAARVAGVESRAVEILEVCGNAIRRKVAEADEEELLQQHLSRVYMLRDYNSLLPIGRTQAKFFLNAPTASAHAFLCLSLRTTEQHVDSGSASFNAIWQPISDEDAAAIAENFDRLGSPRMDVTRVIDTADVLFSDNALSWPHVLAVRYGDWFQIFGTALPVQAFLEQHPEQRRNAARLLRARLYPDGLLAAEIDIIARGQQGAKRTARLTADRQAWHQEGIDFAPWADHVHHLARTILDDSQRLALQRTAGISLLLALGIDARLTQALRDGDNFSALIPPGLRGGALRAWCETGRAASDALDPDEMAQLESDAGLCLFEHSPAGWDAIACPATPWGEQS